MNLDRMINQMAHITGHSRKEVIQALRELSRMPVVQKSKGGKRDDQKAGK